MYHSAGTDVFRFAPCPGPCCGCEYFVDTFDRPDKQVGDGWRATDGVWDVDWSGVLGGEDYGQKLQGHKPGGVCLSEMEPPPVPEEPGRQIVVAVDIAMTSWQDGHSGRVIFNYVDMVNYAYVEVKLTDWLNATGEIIFGVRRNGIYEPQATYPIGWSAPYPLELQICLTVDSETSRIWRLTIQADAEFTSLPVLQRTLRVDLAWPFPLGLGVGTVTEGPGSKITFDNFRVWVIEQVNPTTPTDWTSDCVPCRPFCFCGQDAPVQIQVVLSGITNGLCLGCHELNDTPFVLDLQPDSGEGDWCTWLYEFPAPEEVCADQQRLFLSVTTLNAERYGMLTVLVQITGIPGWQGYARWSTSAISDPCGPWENLSLLQNQWDVGRCDIANSTCLITSL